MNTERGDNSSVFIRVYLWVISVFPSVVESDAAREEFTVGLVTASVWFGGVTAEFSSAFTAKGLLVTNKLKRIPVLSNQNLLDDFI